MDQTSTDENDRSAQIEIKVTWSLAWSLWWRWMVISLVAAIIIFIVRIFFQSF